MLQLEKLYPPHLIFVVLQVTGNQRCLGHVSIGFIFFKTDRQHLLHLTSLVFYILDFINNVFMRGTKYILFNEYCLLLCFRFGASSTGWWGRIS